MPKTFTSNLVSNTLYGLLFCLISIKGISQAPFINQVNPAFGQVGSTVVIKGNNFGSLPTENKVYFGAVKAKIISSNVSEIDVIVPYGATYAPISVTANRLTGFSNKPFDVTFPLNNRLLDSTSFIEGKSFACSDYTTDIAIADFDNDGKPDITLCNYGTGLVPETTVQVFKNITTSKEIIFDTIITLEAGTAPYRIAAADINGDGKLDIITTNSVIDSFYVFINTSDKNHISFNKKKGFFCGAVPEGFAVANIDNDGKPDIAIAIAGEARMAILKNIDSLNTVAFAAPVYFNVKGGVDDLKIADLNGDGKPDICTATGDDSLTIFKNNSSDTLFSFIQAGTFKTGSGSYHITIADLDLDGKPDLITANDYNRSFSVLRNTSTMPAFSFENKVDYAAAYGPLHVSVGDLNGDNLPDIVVANLSDTVTTVYQNNSIPGIISLNNKNNYNTDYASTPVGIADLNADSKPELVIISYNSVTIFRNVLNDVLATKLISFTAHKNAQTVELNWQIANDNNCSYFSLERSGSNNFKEIMKINANTNWDFSYIDATPLHGNNYYRLKQVDNDGASIYSSIKKISFDNLLVSVFPNPASTHAIINGLNRSEQYQLLLTNSKGSLISYNNIKNTSSYDLNLSIIPNGVYYLKIISAQTTFTVKLIKDKID